jgi:acetyl coenzyme A synthetase (ADP forming)-like protein
MSILLDPILKPRSIAVIGASRSANTIGNQILSNLVLHGFTGAVYPVNPGAHSIHSIRAYPNVSSIPDQVDMAIVVVPKQYVLDVADECGRSGVKGLVVISAGFKEIGGEGIEREAELHRIVRSYGMRMVGPNCMGVLNGDPAISMNATFAPIMPPFGGAAFVSQSGAIGASVLDYASEFGIGISQFVSVGNKPDVSGNDLLMQWEHDPTVKLILMYVENFGNPRNFLKIASRITRSKPIIVVKSGRSAVGARAASSHTGALAASDTAVDALLAQAGVLRAASIEEMFDMATAFTDRPLPGSRGTAVLTNAGGPGIIAADALEAQGLDMVELQPETIERLRPLFPEEASLRNPLDMIASANPAGYRSALDSILRDPGVSSAVAIFVPPLGIRQEDIAEAIVDVAAAHPDKSVLTVLMGREGLPQGRAELCRAGIPAYLFPESAARALAAMCHYREQSQRPLPAPLELDVDRTRAAGIIERSRAAGKSKLSEPDVLQLFESYGIGTATGRLARDREEAVAIAERIGFPVVMKIVAPQIIHKSDMGGVRTGIAGADQVREVFDDIISRVRQGVPDAEPEGILVQKMIHGGRETIIGMTREGSFGPLVMFGLGGIFVEVLGDVVFRLAPIGTTDALEMIRGIRGTRLLEGIRGEPASDIDSIVDALLRISQLAVDFPEIQELDINPLLARPDGAIALDGRVLLAGDTLAPVDAGTFVETSRLS